MAERWRKEAVTYDAVEGDTLVAMPSGEWMIQAKIAVDGETLERLFAGYLCKNCLEPQEVPFPEVCNALRLPNGEVVGCFYRMRTNQLRDLEMEYGTLEEVRIGSQVKLNDEVERLKQMNAYEQRTGLVLPDNVKFPNETLEEHGR